MVAQSGSGHAIVLDTSKEFGGSDTGATPMELVLMGLAGCTGIDVVFILGDRMKKTVTGLEVEVEGQRADQTPKVYTELDVTYRVRGPGLKEKEAKRAIQLSAEKYCSVSLMLEKTARIRSHYEIEDETSGEVVKGSLSEE